MALRGVQHGFNGVDMRNQIWVYAPIQVQASEGVLVGGEGQNIHFRAALREQAGGTTALRKNRDC